MSTYFGNPNYFICKQHEEYEKMKKNEAIFDGSCYDYQMRINNFTCGFNMPAALSGEGTFGLPPYAKRMPYLVDKYPACPKDWMRSEGKVKSYFVPVIEGRGMWLDFNENWNHTHHIAVVVSVQGVNPITGMPCNDAHLEQYIEECPKHKVKFGPDRYCSKCDYKWPKQNYINTTGTPYGMLWLDGFRSIDGIVRQYILTAEKMRGVASNIIGKDRVYAIGLSFFVSKEKKPASRDTSCLRSSGHHSPNNPLLYYAGPQFFSPTHTPINWDIDSQGTFVGGNSDTTESTVNYCCDSNAGNDGASGGGTISASNLSFEGSLGTKGTRAKKSFVGKSYGNTKGTYAHGDTRGILNKSVQVQKLEVAAGSKINQAISDDPERLDFWHDTPEAILCINYISEKDCQKIIEKGTVNIEGHKEGFLKEVPVGN